VGLEADLLEVRLEVVPVVVPPLDLDVLVLLQFREGERPGADRIAVERVAVVGPDASGTTVTPIVASSNGP